MRHFAITLGLVAALLVAGCGTTSSTSSSGTNDSTNANTGPVTIGNTVIANGASTTYSGTTADVTNTPPVATGAADTGLGTVLHVSATTGYHFVPATLTVKAGLVTIEMDNTSTDGPHNVALKGNGIDVAGALVGKGDTSIVTAKLGPGTYEYYCQPHEQLGMKGTITVTS